LVRDLIDKIKRNKSIMRTYLGEFEEVVLLTIAILPEQAYGVVITQEIEKQTERSVDFSTVHTTLKRLEEKGFLSSSMGGATAQRGGRRKRFFTITIAGYKALQDIQQVRNRYWSLIPKTLQLKSI
jgi:DNA-binding PadR family transcriptional regulator